MKHKVPIWFLLLALVSCHNDPPMVLPAPQKGPDLKENMIRANKTIAEAEETSINEYVARRGWQMRQTTNGARVWEYELGSGPQIAYEDSVHMVYDVEAINGTTFYKGVEETFVVGRRQEMTGLDEAMLLLHYGSRAKVILPSRMGYGIGGDGDRIPQSAILVIDLKTKNN